MREMDRYVPIPPSWVSIPTLCANFSHFIRYRFPVYARTDSVSIKAVSSSVLFS